MSRSAAAYQKFTEDEIRKANSVDILSLARGYGYEPEKAGRKAVHMKHSGGLYIFPENNRFFQWTGPDDGVKGGAIDFVMREENLSFPEAVGKLIGKAVVLPDCFGFILLAVPVTGPDRKSTRLNSSHRSQSRMPSSA